MQYPTSEAEVNAVAAAFQFTDDRTYESITELVKALFELNESAVLDALDNDDAPPDDALLDRVQALFELGKARDGFVDAFAELYEAGVGDEPIDLAELEANVLEAAKKVRDARKAAT